MSATVWLVILIPIALLAWLVGQVMPTPRDKQLNRLRGHARSLGLHVSLRQLKDPDPDAESRVDSSGRERDLRLDLAAYASPVRLPSGVATRHAPSWRVLWMRNHAEAPYDAGLPAGWKLDRMELPLREEVLARLSALLLRVPRGTVCVEASPRDLTLCWRERGELEEVDAIHELLAELVAFQISLAEDAARRDGRELPGDEPEQ